MTESIPLFGPGPSPLADSITSAEHPGRARWINLAASLAAGHYLSQSPDTEALFLPVFRGGQPFIGAIRDLLPAAQFGFAAAGRKEDGRVDIPLLSYEPSAKHIVICDIAAALGHTIDLISGELLERNDTLRVDALVPFTTPLAIQTCTNIAAFYSLWDDREVLPSGTLARWTYDSGDAVFGLEG